ncbi:MAG: N-(5'-phosphoribosyl)anthranilate isomerase, partial [Candidatus Hydrogenedentota bacterium]
MKVKICGITNLEDALAACDAGVDALGFNFSEEAKKRNRYIEPDAARDIVSKLP